MALHLATTGSTAGSCRLRYSDAGFLCIGWAVAGKAATAAGACAAADPASGAAAAADIAAAVFNGAASALPLCYCSCCSGRGCWPVLPGWHRSSRSGSDHTGWLGVSSSTPPPASLPLLLLRFKADRAGWLGVRCNTIPYNLAQWPPSPRAITVGEVLVFTA